MIIVDEATMMADYFRLSIVEMRLLMKGFGRRTGGFLFPNDLSFVVRRWFGFSFGM